MFHKGEIKLQKRLGSKVEHQRAKRIILTELIPPALNFMRSLLCVYVSSTDKEGNIWVLPIIGNNFIEINSLSNFNIKKKSLLNQRLMDGVFTNQNNVIPIGLLFLDSSNRKRYRVNGWAKNTNETLQINVKEAYPNCPKYIQARKVNYKKSLNGVKRKGTRLSEFQKRLILKSDTFFIGSQNPEGNMDTSHRGGNPGFISITKDGKLQIPDYAGNGLFNTLGNLYINPKAGLLFIDYSTNEILMLTGTTQIFIDDKKPENRYWEFETTKWISYSNTINFEETLINFSPYNP